MSRKISAKALRPISAEFDLAAAARAASEIPCICASSTIRRSMASTARCTKTKSGISNPSYRSARNASCARVDHGGVEGAVDHQRLGGAPECARFLNRLIQKLKRLDMEALEEIEQFMMENYDV
jgi:hypothetical protein